MLIRNILKVLLLSVIRILMLKIDILLFGNFKEGPEFHIARSVIKILTHTWMIKDGLIWLFILPLMDT